MSSTFIMGVRAARGARAVVFVVIAGAAAAAGAADPAVTPVTPAAAAVTAEPAADTGAGAGAATELPPIQVTAGRVADAVADIPQNVSIVTPGDIAKQSPQVLTDLLRGVPGVFNQSSGPGQGIAIIRGLKGSEVLHLVDGMRLNMTFFRNSPSQYVALVDPYNIDRIEVLRGPGATLYGSDAMGGVLQVLTPEHRFDGASFDFRGGARALFGSADGAKIGRVWGAGGRENLSFAAGYTYMDYDEREIADGGEQDFTAYRAHGGDAKMLWSPAPGQELMLSVQQFEMPELPRYFEIVGGPGGAGSGLPVFFAPNDRTFVHARWRMAPALAFMDTLELHLAQQVIDDDRNRLVDPTTLEEENNRSALTGFTLQATAGGAGARWTWGLDLYQDEVDSDKQRTNLTNGAVSLRDPTFPDGAEEQSLGLYADAEWDLAPRWLLQAGARWSRVDTELTATAASAPADISNDALTGHVGSSFEFSPGLRWTANLGTGFRAPNIFDLGTLGRRPNTSPQVINVPNPELEPEHVTSLDTGLKWYRGAVEAEVAVYRLWYRDRIEAREPTGNTVPDGVFGCSEAAGCIEVRSENIARADYWGVEGGVKAGVSSQWELFATLNYTHGEEHKKGETRPANRVPPLNGRLGATWTPSGRWYVEPYVLFASEQDRLDDDDAGDIRIDPTGTDGWVSANVRAGWTPIAPVSLQLSVLNLLDEAYREHGSGIDAPARGAVLSADWRF